MGLMFTARFEAVAVSAAQDVFSLGSPTSGIGLLHAVFLSQTSDVGDSGEIIEEVRIVTGNTTVGSGGSARYFNRSPHSPVVGTTPAGTIERVRAGAIEAQREIGDLARFDVHGGGGDMIDARLEIHTEHIDTSLIDGNAGRSILGRRTAELVISIQLEDDGRALLLRLAEVVHIREHDLTDAEVLRRIADAIDGEPKPEPRARRRRTGVRDLDVG